MADEVNLEFEDEGEGAFTDRLQNQPIESLNRPSSEVPEGTQAFDPTESKAEARRREAERKREVRQRYREEAENRRQLFREQKRESQKVITDTRSDAISSRVAAYSLSAALGFPGYIAASAFDRFLIRPAERQNVAQEKEFQDRLQQQRFMEDRQARRNLRYELYPGDTRTNLPLTPGGTPPTQTGGGPPLPPPGGAGGGGRGGGVGGLGSGGGQPPRLPPIVPPARGAGMAGPIGMAAEAATAVILLGQRLRQNIESVSANVSQAATGIASGNINQGLRGSARTAQSFLDPFGSNVVTTIAVEGFDLLLSTNEAILNSIQGTLGFSPQTLQADILGELQTLTKEIEIARRLDSITAQLTLANTQLELAFQELRAQFISAFGPGIAAAINLLAMELRGAARLIELATALGPVIPGWIGQFFTLLSTLIDTINDQAADLDNSDILRQLDDFFNVSIQVGKAPPGAIPVPPVPNP